MLNGANTTLHDAPPPSIIRPRPKGDNQKDMAVVQPEDREHLRVSKTRLAVHLALESRWEEAIEVNRDLLALAPNNVECYNRLGKALLELGRYAEAREAFNGALRLQPRNAIAKKNLARLARLGDQSLAPKGEVRLDPDLFIAESGKTGLTALQNLASSETLASTAAGELVHLRLEGKTLKVYTIHDLYMGQVEPRLATRLARLMAGGNQYSAVVTSVAENRVVVLIREERQAPELAGTLSFPQHIQGLTPLRRDAPPSYELDDEEASESFGPPAPAWSEEEGEEKEEERPVTLGWSDEEEEPSKDTAAAEREEEN